jgi:hypothetical protein
MKNEENKNMKDMLKKMGKITGMPKHVRIEVFYDEKLQGITGVESEPVIMSNGSVFSYLLQNIFMAHPLIEKTYPPGVLLMAVNGYSPKLHSPLFDGDKVVFRVS